MKVQKRIMKSIMSMMLIVSMMLSPYAIGQAKVSKFDKVSSPNLTKNISENPLENNIGVVSGGAIDIIKSVTGGAINKCWI